MRIRLDRPSMKRYRFLRMFFFLCLSYLSRRLHLYFILFRVTWPKKRVGGVLSLPVLFITSTSYISCFFGELTEFVSFKVLTDFLILIARILKLLNSVQFFMPTRQTVMLERHMINNKQAQCFPKQRQKHQKVEGTTNSRWWSSSHRWSSSSGPSYTWPACNAHNSSFDRTSLHTLRNRKITFWTWSNAARSRSRAWRSSRYTRVIAWRSRLDY